MVEFAQIDQRWKSRRSFKNGSRGPSWTFGRKEYDFISKDKILCCFTSKDGSKIATLDCNTSRLEIIPNPFRSISYLNYSSNGKAVFIGGSPHHPSSIVVLDLTSKEHKILRESFVVNVDKEYLSIPQTIEFPTDNNETAFGFYYPPKNKDFQGPQEEKPPLLVIIHGGPTSSASTVLNYEIQYWTTRGFGVVDVNHRGSTGYGTQYRKKLNGFWGIVDVADCCNAAKYLVSIGKADPKRLAIRGGSAGGFTTLAALAFKDVFTAGNSKYGISDLEAMATDTHKFESRYLDSMIGKYPEEKSIYIERSPIHSAEKIKAPLILFQGLEDEVVPPSQSIKMFETLKRKGIPVAYVPFEGEQHGFRQAANIKRSLDGELYFYGKVFKFQPADTIDPVHIENLDKMN